MMPENLPRVGSALLVRDEANRILLGQRNKDPQRGAWVIPGGKIHAFERIADAAVREIHEETGLEVEVSNQFRVYEIVNPPSEHRIVIYSWGKVVGGTLKASDDLSEVKFFPIEELGSVLTTPLVRTVLEDAGLLTSQVKPASSQGVQLVLIPIPLAGAGGPLRQSGTRALRPKGYRRWSPPRASAVSRRSWARRVNDAPVLFEELRGGE
jgi:8-oxo-dGTP diphosphatase